MRRKIKGLKLAVIIFMVMFLTIPAVSANAAYRPKTQMTSAVTMSGNAVRVVWKDTKGALGYQVQAATNKKFTQNKKSKKITDDNREILYTTLNGLKTGKKYYVRVRAYGYDSNYKIVYGKWSTVKKVTIKKCSTITVTKANLATAKKIHTKLMSGKEFVLKIKGSKAKSKKILAALQEKVKEVNGYDVKFDCGDTTVFGNNNQLSASFMNYRSSGSYKLYTVGVSACKEYKYALTYFKNAEKRAGTQCWSKVRKVSWSEMSEVEKVICLSTGDKSRYSKANMKYTNFSETYPDFREKYVVYNALNKKKASGVCMHFAIVNNMLLDNLNLLRWDVQSGKLNHEWLIVRAKDLKGKYQYILISNGVARILESEADLGGYASETKAVMGKYYPF